MGNFLNTVLFREFRANRLMEKWKKCIEAGMAKEILLFLLNLMSFAYLLDLKGFRANIEGFRGKYVFRIAEGDLTVSAVFDNGRMKVREKPIDNPNITVNFKNGKTLTDYIFSPKQNILGSILKQDVTIDGNLNYLYKFAYMATRLRLIAENKV